MLDNREAHTGVKFADMELIEIPQHLMFREKCLYQGMMEYKDGPMHKAVTLRLRRLPAFSNQNRIKYERLPHGCMRQGNTVSDCRGTGFGVTIARTASPLTNTRMWSRISSYSSSMR